MQKVIEYANKNIEIPWVRVYGFSPEAACEIPPCTALSGGNFLFNLSWRPDQSNRCRTHRNAYHGHLPHLPPPEACIGGLRRMPLLMLTNPGTGRERERRV